MVFPVVINVQLSELDHKEAWVPENWCFQIMGLKRLLRVPWTAIRSNQSILTEITPDYSLEGLMPKLKLQYFGHLVQRANSLEKTLMLGKTESRRRRVWQRMRCLNGIIDSMDRIFWASSRRWWRTRKPGVLQPKGSQTAGYDWVT